MRTGILRHGFWFALGILAFYPLMSLVLSARSSPDEIYLRPVPTGDEIVLVFVTSSVCEATKDVRLTTALERASEYLAAYARNEGARFVRVGIAVDFDPELGLKFLARFGSFNEVHAGQGWLNTGAVRYVGQLPGPAATPQMIVLRRSVDGAGSLLHHSNEHVLLRKSSVEALVQWSEAAYRSLSVGAAPLSEGSNTARPPRQGPNESQPTFSVRNLDPIN